MGDDYRPAALGLMGSGTPTRPASSLRQPASSDVLRALLREFGLKPKGIVRFTLVSRWAAKHVWRVNVNGRPWAYIRYLLGPAKAFPDRWRHMQSALLLYEAEVGPRVLGLMAESAALQGRPVLIEAAMKPIARETLAKRAREAVRLIGRLHTASALGEALSMYRTAVDEQGMTPLAALLRETHERWFEAVTERWLEVGLGEITRITPVISDLLGRLEMARTTLPPFDIVTPTHNDLNAGNFMLNGRSELRMIDFETLSLNNPVADIGIFLIWHIPPEQHYALLRDYPLGEPETILQHMQVWAPLRYLNISAHWAARLTHAATCEMWDEAAGNVIEWLWNACKLVYGERMPHGTDVLLRRMGARLQRKNRRFNAGSGK
jgi:thiamine kinase-like enzyme